MKILFLNPIGNIGGAERVLLTAVAGVIREQPTATVKVITLADGPLISAVQDLGAEATVVPLPVGFDELGDSKGRSSRAITLARLITRLPALRPFVRRLGESVRAFAPDLVHSNGIKTHLLSRFAVPASVPVVWHVHDFYGLRPLARRLLRRTHSRVKAVVAISNAVAEDVRVVLPGVAVHVVPNAVDLNRFAPEPGDGAELDRRAGLPIASEGTVRVGLVATYARWKGHLTLLDAAAHLLAEQPALPVRWYLVGGPIYHTAAQFTEAELREAAATRGLAGVVGFVPFTDDPVAVYRGLDAVVHASTLPEPFGLTIAEAMACGRAVIVSIAGGAAELFTDGIDALGVPPGDAQLLANAVRRLTENGELRERLAENARVTATERFDAAQYGEKLLQVYRSVLSSTNL